MYHKRVRKNKNKKMKKAIVINGSENAPVDIDQL
jgi:hypothetical protein